MQSEYSAVREACKEMGDQGAECEQDGVVWGGWGLCLGGFMMYPLSCLCKEAGLCPAKAMPYSPLLLCLPNPPPPHRGPALHAPCCRRAPDHLRGGAVSVH